ncbi:hypothetical protein MOBUDSM44075_02793 [Mycolicibacterium obuense]|uniref:Uncharacterized protein n=2 Tax=Mycolicibacterium obuense TaxID=1807 RepID=A0A0J6W3C9_9MYCO|nr:hypothetical protein MOBUDSM44075_02793 [Mycolicibacterium obuense]
MKSFRSMSEYYNWLAENDDPESDVEYTALRDSRDPLMAFDLFIKRNVDTARQAEFANGSNSDADFVRRVMRNRQ